MRILLVFFAELLGKYKQQGLEVAAFPCNQFGNQVSAVGERI